MEFEIVSFSAGSYVMIIVPFVMIAAGLLLIWFKKNPSRKLSITVLSAMLVAFAGVIAGMSIDSDVREGQTDEKFAQQLADEYGATSTREFTDLERDLVAYNEAQTVFKRDGKESTVFIKLLKDNDKDTYNMVFTTVDEHDLYPKEK